MKLQKVHHNCHSDAECPPCPVLMEKRCNCGKIIRTSIPCFQKNVSCGKECRKELECGHLCRKICHIGVCQEEGTKCTQPCEEIRPICGHTCGLSCHKGMVSMTVAKDQKLKPCTYFQVLKSILVIIISY